MDRVRALLALLWAMSLLLAGWTLLQLPLEDGLRAVAGLRWWQGLFWILLNLLIIALLVWRWQLLARLLSMEFSFLKLLLIRQAGQAVSFITPGPQFGGEPLQLYWLYRESARPLQTGILVLLLDRFIELLTNFLVLGLGLAILIVGGSGLAHWGELLAVPALSLLALGGMVGVLLHPPEWLSKRLARLADYWRRHARLRTISCDWRALNGDLRRALQTGGPGMGGAVLLSLLGWAGMLFEIWLLLDFAGAQVSGQGLVLVVVSMRLAMLLPLPGGVGSVEAALFWCFQALGLPATATLAFIALMRLRDAMVLLFGLLALRGLRRSDSAGVQPLSPNESL